MGWVCKPISEEINRIAQREGVVTRSRVRSTLPDTAEGASQDIPDVTPCFAKLSAPKYRH